MYPFFRTLVSNGKYEVMRLLREGFVPELCEKAFLKRMPSFAKASRFGLV
jgi:hypothetical protein